jgi:hypothetical protein
MRLWWLIMLLPVGALAQSDQSTRQPVGLFQDMQADTVTSDLFNHFADTPGIAFHVTRPVPGRDLVGEVNSMAALDFDGDGILDVVKGDSARIGEAPSLLLLGNGDGTFRVKEGSGLPVSFSLLSAADLDNDGWTDLVLFEMPVVERSQAWDKLVAPPTEPFLRILHNEQGRRFVDITAEQLGSRDIPGSPTVLADFNQDGWLDLAKAELGASGRPQVVLYQGSPGGLTATPPRAFELAWTALPFRGLPEKRALPALAVWDTDDDGDQDLILRDGGHWSRSDAALLVMANDRGQLRPPLPLPLPQVARILLNWADVNNDGRFDLFAGVQDYRGGHNQMYIAQGDGTYADLGREMGLWAGYNITRTGVWADWNNDGWLDLAQCRVFNEGAYTESTLYLSEAGTRFLNVTATADAALGPGSGVGIALDVDRDGDQDLLLGHHTIYVDKVPLEQTGLKLLVNRSVAGNWLDISLQGTVSNRSALGSRVAVFAGARQFHQYPCLGLVAGGSNVNPSMHFGLGAAAQADSVLVRWPDGRWEWFGEIAAGQRVTLTEGSGESRSGR